MSVSRAIKVYMHTNQLQACPLKLLMSLTTIPFV